MTPNTPLSDDELGAMLGQSVRSKVDDVPTITPAFDGVERRARQITSRRRTAAGLAIGALALFGGLGVASLVSDDENGLENDVVTEPVIEETEPEPTPSIDDTQPEAEPVETEPEDPTPTDAEPEPAPEPELTDWVNPADFGIIDIESDTDIGGFGPIEAPLVGFDENDTVWVASPAGGDQTARADLWQVDGIRDVRYVEDPTIGGDQNFLFEVGDRVIHVDEQKRARVIAENATLVGAEMRLGRPTVYIAFHPSAANDPRTGDLQLVDLRSGEALLFFEAIAGNDAAVRNVVLGGEATFIEMTGPARTSFVLGIPNPDTVPTGFGDADASTLSTDGSSLYWLVEVGADALTFRPDIELTVADLTTRSTTTTTISFPPTQVALDYQLYPFGDQLLVIRSWPGGLENGLPSTSYASPLLLDPATGMVTELGLDGGFWVPVAS